MKTLILHHIANGNQMVAYLNPDNISYFQAYKDGKIQSAVKMIDGTVFYSTESSKDIDMEIKRIHTSIMTEERIL